MGEKDATRQSSGGGGGIFNWGKVNGKSGEGIEEASLWGQKREVGGRQMTDGQTETERERGRDERSSVKVHRKCS